MKNNNKCYIMLRNRWHFGAQILCIPVIYAVYQSGYKPNVISKNKVSYIYKQLPWLESYTEVNGLIHEFTLIEKNSMLLSLQPSSEKNALIAFLKRCRPSIGFNRGKIFDKLWTDQLNYNESVYRGLHYLELFYSHANNRLNGETDNKTRISDALRAPFLSLAESADFHPVLNPETLNFIIMPGGGAGAFKKWGVSNFISTVNTVSDQLAMPAKLHFILGPDEKEEQKDLEKINDDRITIYQNLTIASIAKLVLTSDITLANDCGPAHIAQCIQNGFVGIYDTEKPEWFYENSLSFCIVPQEKNKGINSVKIETVSEVATNILKAKGMI